MATDKKTTFATVQNPPDFPALDHRILKFWDDNNIFQRSMDERSGCEDFVFYDGPPGTNAPPHVGHMMQSALKDLWPRYKTMQGMRVLRKAGWDTHGLPVELTTDRDLKLESKRDVEAYGVQKYVDHCRGVVFRFKETWNEAIKRLGRFVDLDNFYATYTTSYIQSDWWVLKQAWDTQVAEEFRNSANLLGGDRFLYKDYRISAWCPKQGTTLSNFEVAQGYKDVVEIALFPKFRVKGEENTFLVAWTTTAWTLLSNIAIAVGPSIPYVKIRITEDAKGVKAGEHLIVARARLEALKDFLGAYEIEAEMKGTDLAGMAYEPLWAFQNLPEGERGHTVIADEYVTTEDGTGMVHLAPYGEDDHRIMKANNMPSILRVDAHGHVVDGVGEWSGKWFKDEDLEIGILRDLAGRNLLLGKEKHGHTYPFHYKTGSPLMYFPRPGWFIRSTAMREQMLAANERINWVPGHIRDGRFGKWLENVIDWNITRERFWGSPLPVWSSDDDKEAIVVGSIAELNEHLLRSGQKPFEPDADLHKPGIDEIVLISESGRELRREDFVLDSWFNAGIMPWGQVGYPAQAGSVEHVNSQYPADFICEGLDQTRGWFYSLLACSTMLAIARGDEDRDRWSSYKTVICTDLVLDETGEKMSKSKGNVVPPVPMMDKYGADAVRWSIFRNNPWLPVRFGEEPLKESLRQIFIPLWNAYGFFVTYANIDGWKPTAENMAGTSDNLLDKWILTCFNDMVATVTDRLENYDVMPAAASITDFADRLTNWYIRRSRRRFWKSEQESDKANAYRTLYQVLTGLTKVMAPFAPFMTEEMYRNLVLGHVDGAKDSVHLENWPKVNPSWQNDELKTKMDVVRTLVSLGHAARNEAKIKVRQPLPALIVAGASDQDKVAVDELGDLIIDELNVKAITFVGGRDELVEFKAKANFRLLGPRFGKEGKVWAGKIAAADQDMIAIWRKGEAVVIDGETFEPDMALLDEIVPDYFVAKEESGQAVFLDTRTNDDLLDEGYVRELVNKVQNRRKEMDLEVTQRIVLAVEADERVRRALETYGEILANEVLANEMEVGDLTHENDLVKINDRKAWFEVKPL